MMKLSLYILLLCMGMTTYAQQYFNVRASLNSVSCVLTSAYETANKYYCVGLTLDSSNVSSSYGYFGIEFSAFDKQGNKVLDTFYQQDGRNIFPWSAKLQRLSDASFLLAADAADTTQFYMMLFRFDTLGRVISKKEYRKPICDTGEFWRLTDFKPDGYGNWLMLSTNKCSTHHNILLMKLDSSFNIVWHRQFVEVNAKNLTASKIIADTSGYLITGGVSNDNWVDKNYIFQAQLIKTDTAGQVQWTYLSPPGKLTNTIQDVIKTQDGGYVYCGQGDGVEKLAPNGISASVSFKGWVEKIDANRNSIWTTTINNEYSNWNSTSQNVLKELANGDIVVAGSLWQKLNSSDTENYHFGSLTRLDANGNVLTQRTYRYGSDTLTYLVYDMKQTADGGYILCGEARDEYYPYNNPTQRGWLIKVDSNGCMSPADPQCFPASAGTKPNTTNLISIYPNPVTEALYINYTGSERLSLTLYDLMGRALKQQPLRNGRNEVPVQQLPAGIYVYRLSNGVQTVQQGKVVKE